MNNIIEVLKTNVSKKSETEKIIKVLKNKMLSAKINFDLEDEDNILRVENDAINTLEIKKILNEFGYSVTSLL